MGRTFLRQETQIRNSTTYAQNVSPGQTAMETNAVSIQDDFNSLRSQVKRYSGLTNWYDDLGAMRAQLTLTNDLSDIEQHKFLFHDQVLTDVTVTALQNWEILSVAGSEAPTPNSAVGAATTEGTVVASIAGSFGAHNLAEVGGRNAISPKNLCVVRDATTGQVIQSSGRDVFALIQSESATNNTPFDDVNARVQLSFVRLNATLDDLEACPVADIAGKTINYAYVARKYLDNLLEDSYLNANFTDMTALTDVTLDRAIDNQGSTPATQTDNTTWQIADEKVLKFQNAAGTVDLFALLPDYLNSGLNLIGIGQTTSTTLAFGVDVNMAAFTTDAAGGVTFDNGLTAYPAGGGASDYVHVGNAAGTISTHRAMTLHAGDDTGAPYSATLSSTHDVTLTAEAVAGQVVVNGFDFHSYATNDNIFDKAIHIGSWVATGLALEATAGTDYIQGSDGTDMQIKTTDGTLTFLSDGNMTLNANQAIGGEIFFDDINRSTSDFGTLLKLSDSDTEWDDYEAAYGEVSLLAAIVAAGSSASGVTLNNVIDNQGTTPATQATNVFWRIDDSTALNFTTSDGGVTLLGIAPAALGDTVSIGGATLDINSTKTVTLDSENFSFDVTKNSNITITANDAADQTLTIGVTNAGAGNGIISITADDALGITSTNGAVTITDGGGFTVNSTGDVNINTTTDMTLDAPAGGITISSGPSNGVGITAGVTSTWSVTANTANPETLKLSCTNAGAGTGYLAVEDDYKAGSTYATDLVLSDSAAEWSAFDTAFGEVSLLSAITTAKTASPRTVFWGVMTADAAANDNVRGGVNLDATLGNYTGLTFISDVVIHLNGALLRPGVDLDANNDVYPGTAAATGDLKFEFALKIGDVICMEIKP
jgi:hypothetical protein